MFNKTVFTHEQYLRERSNPNSPYTFKPLDIDYMMKNCYKVTQGPDIKEDKPGIAEDKPDFAEDKPGIKEDKPGIKEDKPGIKEDKPGIKEDKPGIKEDKPGIKEDKPGIKEDKPGIKEDKPGTEEDKAGIKEDKPGTEEDKAGIKEDDLVCKGCKGVVVVQALDGTTYKVHICLWKCIKNLKRIIKRKSGIPVDEQRLTLAGKQLEDENMLASYNIKPYTTIHLTRRLRGGAREEALCLHETLRDPSFDYDFTHKKDGSTEYYRGSKWYYRPCGWLRYALKVLGKFPDGDEWLGARGSRPESTPGEWSVSYHGTARCNANSIAGGGYDLSRGR